LTTLARANEHVDETAESIVEIALACAQRSFESTMRLAAVTTLNRRRERKPERRETSW
jgi:hypothetical protein